MARPNRKEDLATSLPLTTLDANDSRFWVTLDNKGVQAWKRKPVSTAPASGQVPEVDINNASLGTYGKIEIVRDPGGSAWQLTDSNNEIVA